MPLEASCPDCQGGFSYDAAQAGGMLACPWCDKSLRLPSVAPREPAKPEVPSDGRAPLLRLSCPSCGTRLPEGRMVCGECGISYQAAIHERNSENATFNPGQIAMNGGVVGGVVLLAIAALWLYLGWQEGFIFWYPLGLAVLGLLALVQGLFDWNWKAEQRRRRRERRAKRGSGSSRSRRRR